MAENHSTGTADGAGDPSQRAGDTRPPRPGLDGIEPAHLPEGVRVCVDRDCYIAYEGADSALIAGGIIHREWIAGLGRHTRRIVLDALGGFTVVGEGMRGTVSAVQREHGAYGIKRRDDGSLRVDCYRTRSEEQAKDMANRKKREADSEQDAWARTKAAHSMTDFAERWKSGVLAHLDTVTGFVEGRVRFDNFPDIKVSAHDREAVRLAAADLRRAIAAAVPKLDDTERAPVSNVIALRRDGHH
jgi:hypothetical protein